jgi:hypothetical protein
MTSRRRRAVVLSVLAPVLAVGLAACGVSVTVPQGLKAPFTDAVARLAAAPLVRYQLSADDGDVTVTASVTNHGEIVGSMTSDGDTIAILAAGGKIYAKPPASDLPQSSNKAAASAMRGKWLTGSDVTSLLGGLTTDLRSPAKFAAQLRTALRGTHRYPRPGTPVTTIDGVSALSVATPLGELSVTRKAPYRVLRLTPGTGDDTPSTTPTHDSLASFQHDEDSPFDLGAVDVPATRPGDVENTYNTLEQQTAQLSTAIDSDLQFTVSGKGNINCGSGGCEVSVNVSNSASAGSSGTITGGTVKAELTATIEIAGEPAGGCSGSAELSLNGSGTIGCSDPGAGGVFSSVEAEKKAQAEAESEAEGGAEVEYQIPYDGEYYVYAVAQVNVSQLVNDEDQEDYDTCSALPTADESARSFGLPTPFTLATARSGLGHTALLASAPISTDPIGSGLVGSGPLLVDASGGGTIGTLFVDGKYKFTIYADHGPPHGHLIGPDTPAKGVSVGQNGKPIYSGQQLTRAQQEVIDRHLGQIRTAIRKRMAEYAANGC